MTKGKRFSLLPLLTSASLMLVCNTSAADRVVVVPLGGTVGNATAADVLKGKTFSSKSAGNGVTGTLTIRDSGIIYTNSIDMEFSLISAGSFVMGSPDGTGSTSYRPVWPVETGRNSHEKQHVVTLTKSFYMQTTEITQSQWQQVMGAAPSHFNACGGNCPVEQVSWDDAHNFIDALNGSEGRSNCNTTPNTCYSLPTESEWEYAARGGTVTAFYTGDITSTDCTLDPNLNKIGWYCGNSGNTTHPVAQKEANNWGLYDMSGNVSEWCKDLWGTGDYPDGPIENPTGGTTDSYRVNRGGSWQGSISRARSAYRDAHMPNYSNNYLGFRLVLPSGQ